MWVLFSPVFLGAAILASYLYSADVQTMLDHDHDQARTAQSEIFRLSDLEVGYRKLETNFASMQSEILDLSPEDPAKRLEAQSAVQIRFDGMRQEISFGHGEVEGKIQFAELTVNAANERIASNRQRLENAERVRLFLLIVLGGVLALKVRRSWVSAT